MSTAPWIKSAWRVDAAGAPAGPAVAVGGRDFSFDPRTLDVRAETGGAQHGRTTDDAGHVYLCHNSDHCIRCMVDDRFVSRNRLFAAPAAKESVAVDGPQAAVFRASPVEPWRLLRTRLRAAGIVPGVVEGGGRPAGYFTSATGITFVRGDAVGDLAGALVVGDVGSNLVHRKRLVPHGAGVRAERIDHESELVASTDIWFRPVQFACGPDGALWIVDMQREVIEHPASLAPPIKKHLDLTSGRDTGRLWRLVAVPPDAADAADAAARTRRPPPRLSTAGVAELVPLLGHANGWHRDTAQRLLVEKCAAHTSGGERHPGRRGDPAAQDAAPLLGRLARDPAASSLARVHAAHAIAGIGRLVPADLLAMLAARDPAVRAAAVRLAEPFVAADTPAVADLVAALVALAGTEPDVSVRLPLALVSGGLPAAPRLDVVRTLLDRDGADPWCRYACFTSLGGAAGGAADDAPGRLIAAWLAEPTRLAAPGPAAALPGLVAQVGRRRDPAELARLVAAIDRVAVPPAEDATDMRPAASDLLAELAAALAAGGADLVTLVPTATAGDFVARLERFNLAVAADRSADPATRARSVRGLASAAPLEDLLVVDEPAQVVRAAIAALGRSRDPAAAAVLVRSLPRLAAEERRIAAAALLRDVTRAHAFLDAIAAGTIPPGDLDRQTAGALWAFPDAAVAARAVEVLGPPPPADRGPLVAAYRASLPTAGDAEAGRAIFRRQCVACHRVEGEGRETGPALAAAQARGPEAMLLGILDPNREVLPAFVAHAAVTADGRVVTGIVAAQSEGSVTLRTAEGVDVTIPRDDLESFTDTKRSLMPEGFERTIDARGMADLIAYLMSAK
jgi:putative heme-binding domain-containing protein